MWCEGDTTLLVAQAGFGNTYRWSNNETGRTLSVFQTGSYSVTVTVAGCESTSRNANVLVNALPQPVITANGANLSTATNFSSYQWALNGTDIPGATAATYTATQTGNYTVRVTDINQCENTSPPVNVNLMSRGNQLQGVNIVVFPNPAAQSLWVRISDLPSELERLEVFNALGQRVYSQKLNQSGTAFEWEIPVRALPQGMYTLRLLGVEGQITQAFKVQR